MKGLQLKTSINKDMTLNFPVWSSSTKKAMFMQVTVTLDAIKKRGHFKAYGYGEAQAVYVEKKEAVKLAKASLSLLDGASKGLGKSKKTLKKAKEAKGVTEAPAKNVRATFQADLKKAKSVTENAKSTTTAAATKMFEFYADLLSVETKYT